MHPGIEQDHFKRNTWGLQLFKPNVATKKGIAQQTGCVEGLAAENIEDEKPERNRRSTKNTGDDTLTNTLEISDEGAVTKGALVLLD